jgi:hypothetical protein
MSTQAQAFLKVGLSVAEPKDLFDLTLQEGKATLASRGKLSCLIGRYRPGCCVRRSESLGVVSLQSVAFHS